MARAVAFGSREAEIARSCGREPAVSRLKPEESCEAVTAEDVSAAASRLFCFLARHPWADAHGYVLAPLRGSLSGGVASGWLCRLASSGLGRPALPGKPAVAPRRWSSGFSLREF